MSLGKKLRAPTATSATKKTNTINSGAMYSRNIAIGIGVWGVVKGAFLILQPVGAGVEPPGTPEQEFSRFCRLGHKVCSWALAQRFVVGLQPKGS
jgi:hypothetical protein